MKILFVASEAAPFVKTGGLGDVVGSLPRELYRKRASVRVILPLYESIGEEWRVKMKFIKYIFVQLAWRNVYCGLFELKHDGVTYYFVDNEYYFKRHDVYGYFDDGERFAFFSKAVIDLLPHLGNWAPDILHCNDWQSALVPIYKNSLYGWNSDIAGVKTVFTIHNIEYRGSYPLETLTDVFGLPLDLVNDGTLEFRGGISLVKGAINCSDYVTTVSPTYCEELRYSYFAYGLEGVIAANSGKMCGILNGIDTTLFNPETDTGIFKNFSAENLEGKSRNKLELQKMLGLNQDASIPLIVCVSRLVEHKGFDLVSAVLDRIMMQTVQIAILGRGEWRYEQRILAAQEQYKGRFSANILYSEHLAMNLYAGGDMFLMPSRFEPCGIAQMISMRYGTVPIVRETGGLKDTVAPYIPETGEGNGFTFANYNADDMACVIEQAVSVYQDKDKWLALIRKCMQTQFGWNDSAAKYLSFYKKLVAEKDA